MYKKATLTEILESISDNESLEILTEIAKGNMNSHDLKRKDGISRKQFYVRTKRFVDLGVINRSKGKLSITNFGLVVYHAYQIMEDAVKKFWKLKAIDSIQASGQIKDEQKLKLIKTILDNQMIENILIKKPEINPISNRS